MIKRIFISIFLGLAFCSFSFGQIKSHKQKSTISLYDSSTATKVYKQTVKQMTPLSFLERMKIKGNPVAKFAVVSMQDSLPANWLKKSHIAALIKLVKSKAKCYCFVSPLSSYIPGGNADVGGYAIWLIEAYKEKRKVSFGLYACPKVDNSKAEKLIQWWKTQLK